jgi:hypothetical protein
MQRQILRTIATRSFALMMVLSPLWQARAQDPQTTYSRMAPLDQYLMTDRNAEIALARSAAPESISREAEVLVLGRHGYETAVNIPEACFTRVLLVPGTSTLDFRSPIQIHP